MWRPRRQRLPAGTPRVSVLAPRGLRAQIGARLRETLNQALGALQGGEGLVAQRLAERIRRDLLPRLAGDTPTLLVGIAGPNNVGKSSLFNALVGRPLSPSRPEGGLTKQCLAAAHPEMVHGPSRAVLEQRYALVEASAQNLPPVTEPGPPGRLYLIAVPELPQGLLLMDTPDFDSVHQTNRVAAEALLVTVDLVLFMVSRHTYQNAAVVDFLREVVGHGRPYALVYNEAVREDVAHAHLDKLASDVGFEPVASELALHQPDVEAGRALLVTRPRGEGPPLAAMLRDPSSLGRLKVRALQASLRDAEGELEEVARELDEAALAPERLRTRLRRELLQLSERAAGLAIPADVLIEAFRDELDARSTTHRWLRKGPRLLATGVTRAGRFLREQFFGPQVTEESPQVRVHEELASSVRELLAALSAEVPEWKDLPEAQAVARAVLEPGALEAALQTQSPAADRERLYTFCRERLGAELKGGPSEELRQLGATFAYAVPALAGVVGAVTVPGVTGGADVVFASALVTTPLLERFVDLLGAGLRDAVARTWRKTHGETLARALADGLFHPLLSRLDAQVNGHRTRAEVLRRSAASLGASMEEVSR